MRNSKKLGHICRNCFNKEANVYLRHRDCTHIHRKKECEYCGEMKYLITGVKFSGRVRMLFHIKTHKISDAD